MQHQDSILQLLKQITEMIDLIRQKGGDLSGKMTPEAIQDFNKLKESVALFNAANRKGFQDANIDIETLKKQVQVSDVVSEEDKRLLGEVGRVEKNLKEAKISLDKKTKQDQETLKLNKDTKQKMKERRKSFKSIGGDKKWIPL